MRNCSAISKAAANPARASPGTGLQMDAAVSYTSHGDVAINVWVTHWRGVPPFNPMDRSMWSAINRGTRNTCPLVRRDTSRRSMSCSSRADRPPDTRSTLELLGFATAEASVM